MTSSKISHKNKAAAKPNDETFHLLFSNHPIPMWVYDLKTLVFLDVNEAALEKYGYTRSEFLSLTIKNILPQEDLERLMHDLEQERPPLQHSGEWRHRLKDGQLIDVEITSRTLDFEGHKAALVMAQDITKRKQTEDALRIAGQQWQTTFDAISDLVCLINSEGQVIRHNRAMETFLGKPASEVDGHHCYELMHGTSEPIENCPFLRMKQSRHRENMVFECNGRWLNVTTDPILQSDGQFLGATHIVSDITERKQAEMELIQSEAKFRSTFDQSPVGSVIVDLDKRFIRCNPAFCNFLGYPESELIGKTISDVTHPEDLEIGMKELKQMLEGKFESFTAQKRYLRKDGAVLWGEISIRLVRDANNELLYFLPIIQNITERKQAEEALKESEKRFATIFRANPAAIAMTRLDDGHLVDVNAAWQRLTGYVHTEVVGRTAQELNLWVHPEQRDRLMEMLGEQSRAHGEMELRHKSGEVRDLLMLAEIIELDGKRYLLTMAQDITEQKRKDEELRNAHNRIDSMLKFTTSIISAIPTPLFYKDREGRYLGVNDAFADLMGHTPDFYVGKTVMELWPDDLAKVYREKDLELMRNPERQVYEFKVMDKDGMIHPVIWGKNVFRDENGQVAGIVGAFVDITERKQAEDALRVSEEKYRQIVDTAGEGIWMIDAEGNTTFANQKMTEMLGYPAGEMLGVSFFTFMDEDGKALAAANMERRRQGIKEQHDFKFRRKDGTDLWAILETNPIVDKDGRYAGALAMLTDITERKQAEEALRESEVKLQDVFNLMQEGMALNELVFDEQGEIVDYRILEVNPSYEWISSLTREQVVGKKATEIYGMSSAYIKEFWRQNQHAVHNIITEYYVPQTNQWRMISTSAPVDNKFTTMFSDITERKQAEEALAESEKKFRNLFETMSEGIVYEDSDGKIISANPAAERLLGLSLDQLQGRTSVDPRWKAIHEDGSPFPGETHSLNVAAKTGKPATGEVMGIYNPKSGACIWLSVNSTPEFLPGEKKPFQAYAVFRDITERKQAEDNLIVSEARYRRLFEAAKDGILILDAETGVVVDVNPFLCEMLGFSHEEICGKELWELGFFKDIAENKANFLELQEKGYIRYDDLPLEIANGRKFHVEFISNVYNVNHHKVVQCNIRDITERKQAENRLRQRSDEMNALNVLGREVTASFSSGSATAVALNGIMNAIQPDLAYLFLRDGEKLILKESLSHDHETGSVPIPTHQVGECMCGLSVSENKAFYSRDIFVDWRCTWEECKKAGVKSFAALPLRSGNEVFGVIGLGSFTGRDFEQQDEFLETLSSQISAALENARLFETVRIYASDLEQRVEARTSELREAQEKLVRNEKLAVLGQLAGGVGHELRNPLAVINNAIYYLKLVGANGNEKVKEYLGIIETEAHTAEKIITDLLDFARIKSVDLEPVSVSKLVKRVLERYPSPKEVHVKLEIPENVPMLYVDPRHAEQVLGNLVINACQAMKSSGGELTITAQRQQEMVAIAVRDTGVGILPENMKKLFEPLFTTKAKGIGLGLAVSQKLAEANGGRIEVQSEAGVGSTFTVYLPVKQ